MLNKKLLLIVSVLALGFTSCPAPQAFPLQGTVSVPSGSDVKDTIVIACNIETCKQLYSAKAQVITIGVTGLTSHWRIDLTAPGKYQVFAVNTAHNLVGIYKNSDGSSIVEAPFQNINITMQKTSIITQTSDLFASVFSNSNQP